MHTTQLSRIVHSSLCFGLFAFGVFWLFPSQAHAVLPSQTCKVERFQNGSWAQVSPEQTCEGLTPFDADSYTCLPDACQAGQLTYTCRVNPADGVSRDACAASISSGNAPDSGASPASEVSSGGTESDQSAAGAPSQTISGQRTGIVSLESPLDCNGQPCSIPILVARLINFILSIVGALAVLMLVYAGILYMTSAGSEDRAKTAKTTITYTIVGIVVIFLSLLIVNFTIRLLGA